MSMKPIHGRSKKLLLQHFSIWRRRQNVSDYTSPPIFSSSMNACMPNFVNSLMIVGVLSAVGRMMCVQLTGHGQISSMNMKDQWRGKDFLLDCSVSTMLALSKVFLIAL